MKYIKRNLSFYEYLYLVTTIVVIFFMINEYVVINTIILSFIFLLLIVKKRGIIKFPKTVIVLCGFLILLLIQIIVNPSDYFSKEEALKEVSRFLIYSLIILVVSNININFKVFLKIWNIIFLFVLLIAGFQFFKLFGINNFLLQFYGESIYFEIAEKYNELSNFRSGSIFINPNGYAKFILSYIAIFLGVALITLTEKKATIFLLSIGIVTALILAGSRTGFLVSLILLSSYFLHMLLKNKLNLKIKNILVSMFLFLIIITVTLSINTSKINFENLRFIQVEAGIGNSLEYKYTTFSNVIKKFEAHNSLVGLGSFEGVWGVTTIDFDIGYLIAFYGVVGIFLYLFMIFDFYTYRRKSNSKFYLLNKYLIIVFLLFGLTGGVFLNLRTFSMLSLLIFVNFIENGEEM